MPIADNHDADFREPGSNGTLQPSDPVVPRLVAHGVTALPCQLRVARLDHRCFQRRYEFLWADATRTHSLTGACVSSGKRRSDDWSTRKQVLVDLDRVRCQGQWQQFEGYHPNIPIAQIASYRVVRLLATHYHIWKGTEVLQIGLESGADQLELHSGWALADSLTRPESNQ